MSDVFHPVVTDQDLGEGDHHAVLIDDWPVLIARQDGQLHAVINRCSHANSPLAGGRLRRGTVMCPLHGARFELASGRCVGGSYRPLKTFACRVSDGWIEVAIPAEKPGLEHRLIPGR